MLPAGAAAQRLRLRIGLTAVILADQAAFLARWSQYLSRRLDCDVDFVARDSVPGRSSTCCSAASSMRPGSAAIRTCATKGRCACSPFRCTAASRLTRRT